MSEREPFGPNLRRARLQRGIALERIAAETKVSADLWAGLERNDFSRWPTGIYARSNIRAYAALIGLDQEATVDEFCRCFPQGDRRVRRTVTEQAALLGHDLDWKDDLGSAVKENRRAAVPEDGEVPALSFTRTARIVAAMSDVAVLTSGAMLCAALLKVNRPVMFSVCALAYHAVSLVALGSTPAVWVIETYLANRHPAKSRTGRERFRFLRSSEKLS
jgi:transcriptional regulator with XRE-family HTH domain